MRHPCDQLPDGRHFLALQQLLLRASQVFIGTAGFFVEPHLFDGRCQLAADRDQQVFFVAGIFVSQIAAQSHDADRTVLAPEQDPDPGTVAI